MKFFRPGAVLAGVAVAFLVSAAAPCEAAPRRASKAAFMRSYGDTAAPGGYIQFCRLQPSECWSRNASPARMILTRERWRELAALNKQINRTIRPRSDEQLYGQLEYWTYPLQEGDCEDYVLLKRRMLIERGWPESTLLITVVRDENGEGHAVLTVRSNRGDMILDNKHSKILPWTSTSYEFVKRQSAQDPNIWVSLAPDNQHGISSAGTESGQ